MNRDIHVYFRRCDQLEPEVLLKWIEQIFQSNEDFFLNGLMTVSFQHIAIPLGSGRPRLPSFTNFHLYCRRLTSILVVKNSDNLCLPSAICLGNSRHEDKTNEFRRLYQSKSLLRKRALALCRRALALRVQEWRKSRRVIPDYHITVFADFKGREVIFEGPRYTDGGREKNHIDLIHGEGHFNVISSVIGAFSTNFYCLTTAFTHINAPKSVPDASRSHRVSHFNLPYRVTRVYETFTERNSSGIIFSLRVEENLSAAPSDSARIVLLSPKRREE
ncbi:hypothetical protein J437_LFUL013856 [Ladona fulva]|uniref:Uncharacterized protein n=1 Tax=Ladona fulva TaxID=123851 RepID=A0A8K0KH85_LADFU|nr:hypothetical protein J437_LFUL013856 [Ladona fulva]